MYFLTFLNYTNQWFRKEGNSLDNKTIKNGTFQIKNDLYYLTVMKPSNEKKKIMQLIIFSKKKIGKECKFNCNFVSFIC